MREMEVVAEKIGEEDIGWQTARRLNALSMYEKRAPSLPHPDSKPHREFEPRKGGGGPGGAAPAGGPADGGRGPASEAGGAAREAGAGRPASGPSGQSEGGAGGSEIELAPSGGGRHVDGAPPV